MIEIAKEIYTATVTVTGGRSGHAAASDGRLEVDLSRPGDPRGTGTNPEQLFAAGYAACFQSALTGVARRRGVTVGQSTVRATVVLGSSADERYTLRVTLTVQVPDLDPVVVRELATAAHQICPYSNATRANIEVTIEVAPAPTLG
ncbi:MAG TPA: organic hydroperoxide resistance protein [Micromonosporaceae bacterium]